MFFHDKWFLYYGCADSRVGVAVFDPKSLSVTQTVKSIRHERPARPADRLHYATLRSWMTKGRGRCSPSRVRHARARSVSIGICSSNISRNERDVGPHVFRWAAFSGAQLFCFIRVRLLDKQAQGLPLEESFVCAVRFCGRGPREFPLRPHCPARRRGCGRASAPSIAGARSRSPCGPRSTAALPPG